MFTLFSMLYIKPLLQILHSIPDQKFFSRLYWSGEVHEEFSVAYVEIRLFCSWSSFLSELVIVTYREKAINNS
jgi:hypothetical protein